ncbi:JAB domain-containing protein [Sediminibacterium roseum]|uniref:JAB domain-containing protein n=1 Tax=Sediminibacterium roseum TaxID=1978412 RepID=A0ABW9ZW72_9BACT|nr:JAB domain-containing protein [Sediminibacterium roseum]NCI51389.1 JAB domain-containing protein [Sediminibacterium roseum]
MNNQDELSVVSEVELIYRSKTRASLRPMIRRSQDSYRVLLGYWNLNKIEFIEEFKVLYLNRGYRVLAINELSTGGMTGTVADPRLIFATALKLNATAVILCHNHPSGNTTPSEVDKMLTEKLKSAGRFLDITVSDHLIISAEGYFSFADEGLL